MDKVFVSSTWEDMRVHYRPAVLQAVREAGGVPVGMEDFGSNTERGDQRSTLGVGQAAIYLVVIGFRYGSLVPGEQISITELEYEMALRRGMPILAYLTSERPGEIEQVRATFPPDSVDVEPTALARLAAFRQRLWASHTCSTYTGTQDLRVCVTRDVRRLLAGGLTEGEIRLKKGHDALVRGDLQNAQVDLQLAVMNLPEQSNPTGAARARFLLSLVKLNDRRPVALMLTQFREIEALLKAAVNIDPRPSYLIVLAAIQLDFARNGMSQYAGEAERFLARASTMGADAEDQRNLALFARCQPMLATHLNL
ncbi:MAG: DUF4062 domain-containing protein [Ktedonobacterales bacterium]|nr:DUF4062 domain-containing protein [Ktedonobacterales bacterium]